MGLRKRAFSMTILISMEIYTSSTPILRNIIQSRKNRDFISEKDSVILFRKNTQEYLIKCSFKYKQ